MFIIGFIIFLLYMSGLLYMIKKSHDDQKRKRMKNPETKNYDQNDYDGGDEKWDEAASMKNTLLKKIKESEKLMK